MIAPRRPAVLRRILSPVLALGVGAAAALLLDLLPAAQPTAAYQDPHVLRTGGARVFAITDKEARVYAHDPAGRSYRADGSIGLQPASNDTKEPTAVTLSLGTTSVAEGAGTTSVEVTATLAAASDSATELTVSVTGDTADADTDFSPVANFTLTIAANSTSGDASFDFTPTDDSLVEGDETLTVSGSGANLAVTAATLTLTDGDSATLSFSVDSATIAESTQDTATLTVAITNSVTFQHAQDIAVTLGGTAAAGRDYTFVDPMGRTFTKPYILVLPAEASSITGAITAVDDDRDDDAETVTLAVAHAGAAFGDTQTITITDDDDAPALELSGLTISTTRSRSSYPDFDADTLHYAVGCGSPGRVEVTPSTTNSGVRLSVAGTQTTSGTLVELVDPEGDSDIEVVLSNSSGESRTYTIHCVPHDFPKITVQKLSGAWDGLFIGSVDMGIRRDPDNSWTFLLAMDTNGVPRLHRKLTRHHAPHFRPQEGGQYPYGYLRAFGHFQSSDNALVLLDRNFNEVRTITHSTWGNAQAGWDDSHLDVHDFLIKPDGTSVIVIDDSITRDLSSIGFGSFGTEENMVDERIIEVTTGGGVTEVWDSWDRVEIQDCTQHNFTGNTYSHFNSIELLADGHYLVSLKGCSNVAKIDSSTGETLWHVGRSNLSAAQWTANSRTAPYAIEDDPHGEFCGQHSAKLIGNGNLLLYDNGNVCLENPETGSVASGVVRQNYDFSRVVEYALDHEHREARFLRQHSLGGAQDARSRWSGLVAPTDSGNWWISWGGAADDPDVDQSITEVDPDTKVEVLHILFKDASNDRRTTRSYPIREDEFRLDPPPLTARIVEAPSRYYPANAEQVRVVVAFSRPVVDFATDTPSLSVTGATVNVSPLIEAGQPANAYVFTLTAAGGEIRVNLLSGRGCSSGAVCTLDGAMLAEVPPAVVIPPEHVPVFASTPPTRSIAENSSPGTNVGAAVTATDADNDQLSYTLEGADAASFEIVETSGQIRTRSGITYDYEAAKSTYSVIVRADDGKSESPSKGVTITVTDVNEPPEIDGAARVTVEENAGTSVGSYRAADPEGEDITWTTLSGADARWFDFDDGALSFKEPPDFEARADNTYEVAVRASDQATGGRTGSLTVTVTVTDEDESPVITGPDSVDWNENATGTVASYRAADPEGLTVDLSLAGDDSGDFTFSSGVLRFATPPDFEDPQDADGDNAYEVSIVADDGSNPGSQPVTITVQNVGEAGMLTLSSNEPRIGVPFTAELVDSDGVQTSVWAWARSTGRAGPWTTINGASGNTFTPGAGERDHYLRVSADYTDGRGSAESLQATSGFTTKPDRSTNTAPTFPATIPDLQVREDARRATIGGPVLASDKERDPLSYHLEVSGVSADPPFVIDRATAQIRMAESTILDHEARDSYRVTVTARDSFNAEGSVTLDILVSDVNEPPVAITDRVTTSEDTAVTVDVLANDTDPENDGLTVTDVTRPSWGSARVESDGTITYTPRANYHGSDSFTYRARDSGGLTSPAATAALTIDAVNDDPEFAMATAGRTVSESAGEGHRVGAPVSATDVDAGQTLTYRLSGADAFSFDIDDSGQITVAGGVTGFEAGTQDTYEVTVEADDGNGGRASIDVTITVTTGSVGPLIFIPGGGVGGGPSGPESSEVDFEWTVSRDIEELDEGNHRSSGIWSDGATLWVLDNAEGAGDAVYAYDLESGERLEEHEFALHETNRAPRGVWSDGEAWWVSDSGQDRLVAYDLESGERIEKREIVLARRNADARGIWSDGTTMWVLDGRKNSVFAYDLESGELLGEYALAAVNGDPHGIWSDGITAWVSDHGEKQLLAYRLPLPEGPEGEREPDVADLERVPGEDFTEPGRVGNNSPRGIWSDGAVIYVADENDDKVYTYNVPDAIDARLASLEIAGVDFGEFSPLRHDYASETIPHGNISAVTATPVQDGASVQVDPPDHDGDPANGHHLRLIPGLEIIVTVTSPDGSRKRVYKLVLGGEEATGPSPGCLRGAVAVGFSLVVFEGGSLDDLVACAESRHVTAVYTLRAGEYVSYILGAPDFVNARFAELYADGVPAFTPLTVKSEGPATVAPIASAVTEPLATCLQGELAEGFNLVVYKGGSVDELTACAEGLGIESLYVLSDGAWVSYILGAPGFVNDAFRELFAEGVPAATPLTVRRG